MVSAVLKAVLVVACAAVACAVVGDVEPSITVEDSTVTVTAGHIVLDASEGSVQCIGDCFPELQGVSAVKEDLEDTKLLLSDVNASLTEFMASAEGLLATVPETGLNLAKLRTDLDAVDARVDVIDACLNCGGDKFCTVEMLTATCVECSLCPAGKRVSTPCGVTSNTECEDCPDGFYSPDDKSPCFPCHGCPTGEIEVASCTKTDDAVCRAVDHCELGNHNCHESATCFPSHGNYGCECNEGFYGNGFKCLPCSACPSGYVRTGGCDTVDSVCSDVDECATGTPCHASATCTNTIGSYECTCPPEHAFDAEGICVKYHAEVLRASVNNAGSIVSGAKVVTFSLESTTVPDILNVESGEVLVGMAGFVSFDYHQDVQHSSGYVDIYAYVKDTTGAQREIARELASHTFGYWDGIGVSGHTYVDAGSKITFSFGNTPTSMRDGVEHGSLSVRWIKANTDASVIKATLNNAASIATVAGATMTYTQTYAHGNVGTDVTLGSNGHFTFSKSGVFQHDNFMDMYHRCSYVHMTSYVKYPGDSAATMMNSELQTDSYDYWDGLHLGGSVPVVAGTEIWFDFFGCAEMGSIDNGLWSPMTAVFLPDDETSSVVLGRTTNAASFINVDILTPKTVVFENHMDSISAGHHAAPVKLDIVAGELKAMVAGTLVYDFHQDLKTTADDVQLMASLVGAASTTLLASEFVSYTWGDWDGVAVGGSVEVEAGDIVRLSLVGNGGQITAMDNGQWGTMSAFIIDV
eukprot:m.51051 g.51051  ORF g.51051 m.51051 type:complete len:751 (+) comp12195_c0_seq2:106-2358(+)